MQEYGDLRIGRNVRRLRQLRGLSQAELAERLTGQGVPGFHPQTITKIEAGNRALKFTEALGICRALGARAEELAELDEAAVLRWMLEENARGIVSTFGRAVDALTRFLEQADSIGARARGVTDPETLGLAQAAAELTLDDIVRKARAEFAGDVAKYDTITAAGGPGDPRPPARLGVPVAERPRARAPHAVEGRVPDL